MKKIKLIAIIGKAGSGKNTILQDFIFTKQNDYYYIMDNNGKHHKHFNTIFEDKYNVVIPFTTRPIRPGEQEGKDYYYLNPVQVAELLEKKEVFQCTTFNNWYYGFMKKSFDPDKFNIGIFNPEAVIDLQDINLFDIITIYIEASDKDRLLRQLNREEEPNVKEIVRRFSTDDYDFREEILAQMPNLNIINNPNQDLEYPEDFSLYSQVTKLEIIIDGQK